MADIENLVLVVEDDELVQGYIASTLGMSGRGTISARTGAEALAQIESTPGISVVLLDALLPDMHGAELARSLLQTQAGATVGICFVTGTIREGSAAQAGVAALSKPVRPAVLQQAVTDLLGWRSHGGSPLDERNRALDALTAHFTIAS